MSDKERRRQEEERRRFERIRSLNTIGQETHRGRRRHPSGAQPFNEESLFREPPRSTRQQETPTGRNLSGAQPFNVESFFNAPLPPTRQQETHRGRRRHPSGAQSFNVESLFSAAPPHATELKERFERLRSPDTGVEPTPISRRRVPSGAQPYDHFDSFSRDTPLQRTRSYGEMPSDIHLSQQFSQSLNLSETQPHQRGSRYGPQTTATTASEAVRSGSGQVSGRANRTQPAPSALSRHIAGQQRTGQSTRPTGIPHFARQEPIPEPQLVHRYRDPVTGMPSLDRLRQPAVRPRPGSGGHASSTEMGSYLANLSRDNIIEGIFAHDIKKSKRKKDVMVSRGFQRVVDKSAMNPKPVERFVPQSIPEHISQTPRFVPQTEKDRIATRDYRFNRPQREMDKPVFLPHDSKYAPVGRQQWGPLRRAYSLPDLSDPNLAADIDEPSRMAQFEKRLFQMPTPDRESYKHFHDQVSTAENPNAMTRMVPRPTIGNIRDKDRRRLKEIAYYRAQLMTPRIGGNVTADIMRRTRRNIVRDSAYHKTALPNKTVQDKARAQWLAQGAKEPIPEEEDEYEEEEEE